MNRSRRRLAASALVLAIASQAAPPVRAAEPPTPLADHRYGAWGFDLAGRDLSVRPGDGFFEYANGGFLQRAEIPPDVSWYGTTTIARDLAEARVRHILDAAAQDHRTDPQPSDIRGKLGIYYASFLDEARVEALGAKPLARDLDVIRAAKGHADLAAIMGRAPRSFHGSVFRLSIAADDKDPDRYAVSVDQGGLGLPDRDYYLEDRFAAQRAAYLAYVGTVLRLIGWPEPERHAAAVMALETRIAVASWSRTDSRDVLKTYNPMSVAALRSAAPDFDWPRFLAAAGLGGVERVIVPANTAVPRIAKVFAETPLETLKAYEAFRLADAAAAVLSKPFVDARFAIQGRALLGQPENPVRWKRGVRMISPGVIGEAIGQLYVQAYFPPSHKAQVEAIVAQVRTAYRSRIEGLRWMGPETKARALEKLAAFDVQVGYPKKWNDYSSLVIRRNDLYGNAERALAWTWAFRMGRLGKPVDKDEWGMTPQQVNAYNRPNFNEVVFPAGILQPPVFDAAADPAVNYGGFGAVVGHEMSHGFDDQGRRFDARGRLSDWWTAADEQSFVRASRALGAQYEAIPILPGARINGALTMGENIADLGGVLVALDAYHASLGGRAAPIIDGLTGDQRFFLGYALYYRNKAREDRERWLMVSDVHAPDKARVDVVLRNVDAWYDAFGVRPGDQMYLAPSDRVRIW